MKFVPLSKVNEWQFSKLDGLGGRGYQLKTACVNFVELMVAREAVEQLKGVPVTIIDLDGPLFNIGSGMVEEGSGLYKMIKLRIENACVALKRQIIADLEENKLVMMTDWPEMDMVLRSTDRNDVKLASAIQTFRIAGSNVGINVTKEMKAIINNLATKIKDEQQLVGTSGLYANTWFSKWLGDKVRTERNNLNDSIKVLANKVKEVCDAYERNGVTNVEDVKSILGGAVKRVYCIDYIGRKRVATKSEIERLPGNMYVEYANIIDIPKYYSLLCTALLMTGENGVGVKIVAVDKTNEDDGSIKGLLVSMKKDEPIGNIILNNTTILCKNMDNFLVDADITLTKVKGAVRELEYPDKPLDNMVLASEVTLPEMIERIIKEKDNMGVNNSRGKGRGGYTAKKGSIALNIAIGCKKKEDYMLSLKQMHIVKREYEMLRQMDESGITVTTEECLSVANELMNNYRSICNEVIVSIAESTIKKGICTYKQLEVLKKRLNEIKGYERMKAQSGALNAADLVRGVGFGSAADTQSGENTGDTAAGSIPAPAPVFGVPADNGDFDIDAFAKELFG